MLVACEKVPILDKIIEGLYIGDIVASNNLNLLKEKEISVVISLIDEDIEHQKIEYHKFPIEDNRNENITKLFEQTNKLIDVALHENKNILVHCHNAVSRSVTIILSYLMSTKLTLREAFCLVKNNRTSTFTRPNIGFAKQLVKYEALLYGENTITVSEMLK